MQKGKKHKCIVRAALTTTNLDHFRLPGHSSGSATSSECIPPSLPLPADARNVAHASGEVEQVRRSCDGVRGFMVTEMITRAEIMWTFAVIMSDISSRGSKRCVEMFPHIFNDSTIATKFSMKKDKLAYAITYGLGPYLQDKLSCAIQNCKFYVVSFDESLNKVVQEGQMDIVVRYWNVLKSEVATRYLTSTFLKRSTAKVLFDASQLRLASTT